ncbi:hypothetical protein F0237_21900 [Vibrio tubiashii]|uniref:Uncharacterized protein n=1 Tax=Vibrio tubiashii TaxID=29498 RepID=A0AAE5LK11_9VIBR|nr:hypothetical protein [Vibrio tubiashii]NOI83316.1 hypothetical protein [Vibrio tubiashii]
MIVETVLFFVVSALVLATLYRVSKLRWSHTLAKALFILTLAVLAGQYLVIFKDGSSLSFFSAITPDYSSNVIVQFSSLVIVFLLSFCIPKNR